MSRLQKKCFLASAALHTLLIVVLFVGSAFFVSKEKNLAAPPLTFIPNNILDSALSGGGNPHGSPPPPAPAKVETPQPKIETPVPPKVEPAKPAPEPPRKIETPVKKIGTTKAREVDPPPVSKTADKRPKIDLSKPVTRKTDTGKQNDPAEATNSQREKAAAARAALASGIKSSLNSLKNNLSSPISIEPLGPGGAAFANYGQIVVSIYEAAWIIPNDVSDDNSAVMVSVTIARDGRVITARVTQRSGKTAVDKSVQQTLEKVRFIAPFPAGATDAERTFEINFNLKAKRLLG